MRDSNSIDWLAATVERILGRTLTLRQSLLFTEEDRQLAIRLDSRPTP
jgi:hypothetical protein